MSVAKKWRYAEYDEKTAELISKKAGVSALLAKVLAARGFTDPDTAAAFLNTDKKHFYNPFLLDDMDKAAECIKRNVALGKKTAVYGDYDVDGITSTYILYDYLKSIGANVIYYIPDRSTEGYGMNCGAIDKLYSENVSLIITVDVGITATDETEYAKSLGMEVIITDHHTVKDKIPNCTAVINPKRNNSNYPYNLLAGVGVAFKLVYALSNCSLEVFNKYSDIAAVGTVADMVPLTDENRYIVTEGLKKLKNTDNTGLNALIKTAGLNNKKITSSSIGYTLAPRLNAAGRLASAQISVDLLLEKDEQKALMIARQLENGNKLRQAEEQKILKEAVDIIERNKMYNDSVIVVAAPNWHHGVIGIVSSRITEMYYKPSAVISISDDGTGKASGRSIKGFNLFDALSHCSDCLQKFGGHELAAGFSLKSEKIDEFRSKINEYAKPRMTEDIITPVLNIDAVIKLNDITENTVKELEKIEPCGIGNRTPVFAVDDAKIDYIRYLRESKHAFLTVKKDGIYANAPAFNMADRVKYYTCGDNIAFAGILGINTYNGVTTPQFIIRDLHLSESCNLNRTILKYVFKSLKNHILNSRFTVSADRFLCTNSNYGTASVMLALKVFKELNIIKYDYNETKNEFKISAGENFYGKTELTNSDTYLKYNK